MKASRMFALLGLVVVFSACTREDQAQETRSAAIAAGDVGIQKDCTCKSGGECKCGGECRCGAADGKCGCGKQGTAGCACKSGGECKCGGDHACPGMAAREGSGACPGMGAEAGKGCGCKGKAPDLSPAP